MKTNAYSFYIPHMCTFFVRSEGEYITHVTMEEAKKAPEHIKGGAPSQLLEQAADELQAYCEGSLSVFSVPLNPSGTLFQKKVWDSLIAIPYGTTVSYGKIASLINCPKGARAVGGANNKNPIAVMIPCHRVVGANGSMTGYAYGISLKEKFLALEVSRKLS